MAMQRVALAKPYKFLDHYESEDREIFFGREREIEILLSDVIATRLVVLFARTGSGKTSLINAGVRPRLEELDYATFYVRVEKDPIASVRKALQERDLLQSNPQDQSLAAQFEYAASRIEKPIVVFFDQFEEFFIYVAQDQPDLARQFISDIAKLYRNRDSGVHLVFSMREEFYVEMDAFRDEIPSFFHSDSSLRLRWFDEDQARDAIVKPAQRFDTRVEESLVKLLIHDLQQGGRIEPARLQIVCDTLWQRRSDARILLADYEQLGGAERILDRRLVQDITANLDDEMLRLFEMLLPELVTERGTKYVRGFDELAKSLKWNPTLLQKLAEQLSALGLLRFTTYSGALFIEWTSDYVAERTAKLQERVRAVSLTRQLQSAMDKAGKLAEVISRSQAGRPAQLTFQQRDALYLSDEAFETLSAGAELVSDLDRQQAEFLFLAALEHGDHMRLWFEQASARGVAVWDILENRVTDKLARVEQAENTVRLLGELKNEQALELLSLALQTETLSSLAVKVLGRIETPEAIQLLEAALQQEALAPQVLAVLSQSDNPKAAALLQSAFQQSDLAPQAEWELDRISKSKSTQAAGYAGQVLKQQKTGRQSPPAQPPYRPAEGLPENDWASLLRRIEAGKCTPVIGPQVLAGVLPTGAEIARQWAAESDYPLSHSDDLPQVAQYLAVRYRSPSIPREKLAKALQSAGRPSLTAEDEPHSVLGSLPFNVYITTNYDAFMEDALRSQYKAPQQDILRWNNSLEQLPSTLDGAYTPYRSDPLVFHLHGVLEMPESLVLTEDDYWDYLVSITSNPDTMPHLVQRVLATTQLLFIGFDLMGRGFRILLRSLASFTERSMMRYSGISVGMSATKDAMAPEAQRYIEEYFRYVGLQIYWGTPQDFVRELARRWKEYDHGG